MDSTTTRTIECVRTQLREVDPVHKLFLLRINRECVRGEKEDSSGPVLTKYAVVKALHSWIHEQRLTSVADTSSYQRVILQFTQRAARRASTAYAILAVIAVTVALLPSQAREMHAYIGVGLLASTIAFITYFVARTVLATASLEKTVSGAMWRGAIIAVGSFVLAYLPVAVITGIWEYTDNGEVANLVLALGLVLMMSIFPLILVGGITGLVIEYALFRASPLGES